MALSLFGLEWAVMPGSVASVLWPRGQKPTQQMAAQEEKHHLDPWPATPRQTLYLLKNLLGGLSTLSAWLNATEF